MNLKNFSAKLWEPANSTGIDLFRKCLAILLIVQLGEFYSADFVNKMFLLTKFRIPFDLTAWVPTLHGKLMHLPFLLQLIGALLLFTNKYARHGALIYLLSFGYIFVLDISYHNNHFYFILLLCFFFCFYKPVKINSTFWVPKVLLYLFQFQVIVVYFYSGVAKLNQDWLFHQEPMREMLQLTNKHHWSEPVVFFYTYVGLVFDLIIGFLLIIPATLRIAVILNIIFHLSNVFMFSSGENTSIGIFPLLMIATNILFIDPDKLQKWLSDKIPSYFKPDSSKKKIKWDEVYNLPRNRKRVFLFLTAVYTVAQLTIPLRHFLIPGNVDWTSEGFYFSWRLKIRSKTAETVIKVKDSRTGKFQTVNPYGFLNTLQYKAICEDPAGMYSFIRQLKNEAAKVGMSTEFYVNWTCKMNGHPSQAVVDSTIEFSGHQHKLIGADNWILPFK